MTLNKDYMAIELYPCNKITVVKPIFRIAGIIVNLTFTPIHSKTLNTLKIDYFTDIEYSSEQAVDTQYFKLQYSKIVQSTR